MANVFLDSNETFPSASSNFVFGRTSGNEGVNILTDATNVTVDQNIERVGFPDRSGAYWYQQAGNTLKVFKTNGTTLIASIPLQNDADGTIIEFSDGAKYQAKLSDGKIKLGTGEVPSAPGAVDPGPGGGTTYTLSSSSTAVNETAPDNTVTFTLSTDGVNKGTEVPYTITGIDAADLASGSLVGSFIVGTRETASVTLKADNLTEGKETLTLALTNGSSQVSVDVNDTSKATRDIVLTPADGKGNVTIALDTSGGVVELTGNDLIADGGATNPNILRLTGDADVRLDVSNPNNQLRGIDLNGKNGIAQDGRENDVSGADILTVKNYEVFDAYPRKPLNANDTVNNYKGKISFDGTGFDGDGVSTDGNIVLGGLGSDILLGGDGNDFITGGNGTGGTAIDVLRGGRNADFMYGDFSPFDGGEGNGTTFDGGSTTDDSSAGKLTGQGGARTQDNDWILVEGSDDNEPMVIDLGGAADELGSVDKFAGSNGARLNNIESMDASGNLYGFLDQLNVVLGGRRLDDRINPITKQAYNQEDSSKETDNYGFGSTAQLRVTGSPDANIVVGGYDNDSIDGQAGNDIIFGGNLSYLRQHANNPNLLTVGTDGNPGNKLSISNDGLDSLIGGSGNDSITLELDGGAVVANKPVSSVVNGNPTPNPATPAVSVIQDGTSEALIDPRNRAPSVNVTPDYDMLYLTDFTTGRVPGTTVGGTENTATAQAAALDRLTTDSIVRIDLGLQPSTPTSGSTAPAAIGGTMYRNYGGADLHNNVDYNGFTGTSADDTNYDSGFVRTTITGMEGVITTGLGDVDYRADGANNASADPAVNSADYQQNVQGSNVDMALRGVDVDANGTSRVYGIFTDANFGYQGVSPSPVLTPPTPLTSPIGIGDNILYANTGDDLLEGRQGDDFLSGGKGDDDFYFTGVNGSSGDNTDIIWRQQDADGNNLWDVDAKGEYLYTRDFRPYAERIGTSQLKIDLTASGVGANPTITLSTFKIVIDANGDGDTADTTDTKIDLSSKSLVGSDFKELTAKLDAALHEEDSHLSAVWKEDNDPNTPAGYNGTVVVTDDIGRAISDNTTNLPGYSFGAVFPNYAVSNKAKFAGYPVPQVEDDRILFKSYLSRQNNVGTDDKRFDLGLSASDLSVGFDTVDGKSTTLTNAQQWRVQFEQLKPGDIVSVTVNGKTFTTAVSAGQTTDAAVTALMNTINDTLDWNTSAGRVSATQDNVVPGSTEESVLVLQQKNVGSMDSRVFMQAPTVNITNTIGGTSGVWAVANTSTTSIDIYQFDGRNGNLNGEDVLFVGQTGANAIHPDDSLYAYYDPDASVDPRLQANKFTQSVLLTATKDGGVINGKDAVVVSVTGTNPNGTQENISNGKAQFAGIHGDDQIIGGVGNDTINAGTGDDLIFGSAGTDSVDGGANTAASLTDTITYTDTLLFQESDFGQGSSFYVTLDPVLGSVGKGTVKVTNGAGTDVGITSFNNIEWVRTTSNAAKDTLDVQGLSDAIAAKSAPSLENGEVDDEEGVSVALSNDVGSYYNVDLDNNTIVGTPGIADSQFTFAPTRIGNEVGVPITNVVGVENVITGSANDTVYIDDSQLGSNNIIKMGSQKDDVYPASDRYEGADWVIYKAGNITTNTPTMKVAVGFDKGSDVLTFTGGVLGGATTTDTLDDVEVLDIRQAAPRLDESLDLSSFSTTGATVNFGAADFLVSKTAGANIIVDNKTSNKVVVSATVSDVEGNTLENGGIVPTNAPLGRESLEINGITRLERVTGSDGADRIISGDVLGSTVQIKASPLGKASVFGDATAQFENAGLYQFDLKGGTDTKGGSDSLDYYFGTKPVDVLVDTTGTTSNDWVLVGAPGILEDTNKNGILDVSEDKNGNGVLDANGRVDYATNVERYYGSSTAPNTIDLTGTTGNTTIQFSKYSYSLNNNMEIPEPNGSFAPDEKDLTRGVSVYKTGEASTEYAVFMERTGKATAVNSHSTVIDGSPARVADYIDDAYWTRVVGSIGNETVLLTDNETAVHRTLSLGGGVNTVDYSALTTAITAKVGSSVNASKNITQGTTINPHGSPLDGPSATVGVERAADRAFNNLQLIGSGQTGDILDVTSLQTSMFHSGGPIPDLSEVVPHYHLVDLNALGATSITPGFGTITEDPNGKYTSGASMGFVTYVKGFENVSNAGDNDVVRLKGDAVSNWLEGGNGGDIIEGGLGTGLYAYAGDTLVGGAGPDRFIYNAEVESPGGVRAVQVSPTVLAGQQDPKWFATNPVIVNTRDSISGFTQGEDRLVFNITDAYKAVKATGGTIPTVLSKSLNADGTVAIGTEPDGSISISIDRDAPSNTAPWNDQDNYGIQSNYTIQNQDVALHVTMSAGTNILDASAGLAKGALSDPSDDGVSVEFVYTAPNQSQSGAFDQIVHFNTHNASKLIGTGPSDKIDLSFLKANEWEVLYGSQYDEDKDNIADAIEEIRTLPPATVTPGTSLQNLFKEGDADRPIYRAVAIQTGVDNDLNGSTFVFVDVDHDGNYNASLDMAINLVGVPGSSLSSANGVSLDDFIFTDAQYNRASTPPTAERYAISHTPASVNEGSAVTFTLSTANVPVGTVVPFSISGTANAADIQANPPTNFVVGANGTATAVFAVSADQLTEGQETLALSLTNGKAQDSVVINDTSIAVDTYALSHAPASVNEGSAVTFTLTTTNVASGTVIPFTIGGTVNTADYQANSPTSFVVGANGIATAVLNITADQLTEGPETLSLSLTNGRAQDSVAVNDTSLSIQNVNLTAGTTVTGTAAAERFIYEFKMVGGRAIYAGDGEVTVNNFNPANDILAFDDVGSNQVLTEAQFLALPGVVSVDNPFAHNTTVGFDSGPNGESAVLTLTGIQDPSFNTIVVEVF